MFLKETTVRRGRHVYVYVQLVEGYRDERGRVRQRVVANLGRREKLKASGELDRLAAAFTRLGRLRARAAAAARSPWSPHTWSGWGWLRRSTGRCPPAGGRS